jgi:transposase-like protein
LTEFKARAVARVEAGEPTATLAVELGVRRKLLYDWRDAYRRLGIAGLSRPRGRKRKDYGEVPASAQPESELAQARTRVAELERLVGRQQVDLDFFHRALRLTDAQPPSGTAPKSTRSSKP